MSFNLTSMMFSEAYDTQKPTLMQIIPRMRPIHTYFQTFSSFGPKYS